MYSSEIIYSIYTQDEHLWIWNYLDCRAKQNAMPAGRFGALHCPSDVVMIERYNSLLSSL